MEQLKEDLKNLRKFELKLEGKTAVYVDWANVYGWKSSLKKEVDPKRLFDYLKKYPEVQEVNFYCGQDKHPKSKEFLGEVRQIGFRLVSKDVKYIPIKLDSSYFKNLTKEVRDSLTSVASLKTEVIGKVLDILSRKVMRRKCDFDMEISLDTHKAIAHGFKSFVFLSGDGDFAPLYKLLINLKKQVIVIFAHGHMGKEVYQIKRGIFTKAVDKLEENLFV